MPAQPICSLCRYSSMKDVVQSRQAHGQAHAHMLPPLHQAAFQTQGNPQHFSDLLLSCSCFRCMLSKQSN